MAQQLFLIRWAWHMFAVVTTEEMILMYFSFSPFLVQIWPAGRLHPCLLQEAGVRVCTQRPSLPLVSPSPPPQEAACLSLPHRQKGPSRQSQGEGGVAMVAGLRMRGCGHGDWSQGEGGVAMVAGLGVRGCGCNG